MTSENGRCADREDHLTYAIFVSNDGKNLRFYRDNIKGKDEAYEIMRQAKIACPGLIWKTVSRPVADGILHGIKLGRAIEREAREERVRESLGNQVIPTRRELPSELPKGILLALPDNL